MPRYILEACNDGQLFREGVDAPNREAAETAAIHILCKAFRLDRAEIETIDDIGTAAIVSEYTADDYARDAAPALLSLVSQISTFSTYGDGPDELDDNEDAALALNGLIQQARALVASVNPAACADDGNLLSEDGICGFCGNAPRTYLQVRPVKLEMGEGGDFTRAFTGDTIEAWGVYHTDGDGIPMHVQDFDCRGSAEAFARMRRATLGLSCLILVDELDGTTSTLEA